MNEIALANLTALFNAGSLDLDTVLAATEELALGFPAEKILFYAVLMPAKLRTRTARFAASATGGNNPVVIARNVNLTEDFSEIISDGLKVIRGSWLRLNSRWLLNGAEIE